MIKRAQSVRESTQEREISTLTVMGTGIVNDGKEGEDAEAIENIGRGERI